MSSSPPLIVTLGESMGLIHSEAVGSLTQVSAMQLSIGGAESNVAIGLARLGTRVAWLGRIGIDSIGRRISRELRAEGIEVHAIEDPTATTAVMLKEHPTFDSTVVHYYRSGSAGSKLDIADLDSIDFGATALLHVTGITLSLSQSARDTVHAAVTRAAAAGVPVSFDINHRSRLWSNVSAAADAYREIIEMSTVVFAGEDEAELVVGKGSAGDLASRLAQEGPSDVIIKRGAEGCVALIDGSEFAAAAIPVRVIDTVGAGDAFVAGYLAEKVAGLTPEERLHTAVRAGAVACTHPGDWEGFAYRSDLNVAADRDPVRR